MRRYKEDYLFISAVGYNVVIKDFLVKWAAVVAHW